MYFRGSWKQPFDVVEPGTFYKSNTEKKQVPMMKTTGVFKTGSLPGLDSTAIEFPYDVSKKRSYILTCSYHYLKQKPVLFKYFTTVSYLKRDW